MAETKTAKRILIAGGSTCGYVNLAGAVKIPAETDRRAQKFGYVFRWTNESNCGLIYLFQKEVTLVIGGKIYHIVVGQVRVVKIVAGVSTTLAQWEDSAWREGAKLEVLVDTEGNVTWGVNGETLGTFNDAVFKAGGTLKEGKLGVWDEYPEAPTLTTTREYSEPVASSLLGGEAPVFGTCFAGRKMEFRTDGVFRQHPTAEVWARLVPDGFLPIASPSGLEARAMKGIIVPSVGNFEELADSAKVKGAVKAFYFPGYHFASEAA